MLPPDVLAQPDCFVPFHRDGPPPSRASLPDDPGGIACPGCPSPEKPLPRHAESAPGRTPAPTVTAGPTPATPDLGPVPPEQRRMIRFLVRFAGFLLIAAAFVAVVIDGIRSIAAGRLVLTPLGEAGFRLFPKTFPLIEPGVVRHVHPVLWDPILLNLFTLPTWLVTGLLGIVLLYLGRRPAPPVGVLSRR